MPKLKQATKDEELEAKLAELREFQAGFKRSKRGNLWRHYEGLTLCVFKRDDDYFAWSISDADGPRYSPGAFEDEDEALASLAYEMDVARW
jgi:hypothetical protein